MRYCRWLLICSLIVLVASPAFGVDVKIVETKLSTQASYIQSGNAAVKFFAVKVEESTSLRVVLAHDQVDGKKETVASMCQRAHCIAGVNGDFFGGVVAHGGLISKNHIIRTPDSSSGQAWIGQGLEERPAARSLAVVRLGNGVTQQWPINISPILNKSSIYTNIYGGKLIASIESPILIYQCTCEARPDSSGKTYQLKMVGNIVSGVLPKLNRNQIGLRMPAVLMTTFMTSGQTISLRLPVVKSSESIGAHPVILRNNRISTLTDPFSASLHPRTVFGCNARGQCWLIAIDTRVTLQQAAKTARALGVTDGINLDGGGSTTFVVQGKTLNNPADKAEREVASAILVVKNTTKKVIIKKGNHQNASQSELPTTRPLRSGIKSTPITVKNLQNPNESLRNALSSDQGGNPMDGLGAVLIIIALIMRRVSLQHFHYL